MRSVFEEQLAKLNDELISMGALCEEVIALVGKSILLGDSKMAESVGQMDSEIDQKERDIETMCLKLLLRQQPVARDLRQISAALKLITDMERIGDQASDIAEIIGFINGRKCDGCIYLGDMARATIEMVTGSVDAYVKKDVQMAKQVVAHDDVVDGLFIKAKESLIKMIASNPQDGEYALDLLMIAKYFERIGDHATNIAEWAIFAVTGVHVSEEVL